MTGATIAAPAVAGNAGAGDGPDRWEDALGADAPVERLRRLADALGHEDKHRRREAALALSVAIGRGQEGAASLSSLLAHANAEVRWGAAFALHRAGQSAPGAVDISLAALADSDRDIRWAAAELVVAALGRDARLAGRLRERLLGGDVVARKMALFCLARGAGLEASDFEAAFADDHPQVRLAAWTALARSASPTSAVQDLARAAAVRETDPAVVRAATAVLARLDAPVSDRGPT